MNVWCIKSRGVLSGGVGSRGCLSGGVGSRCCVVVRLLKLDQWLHVCLVKRLSVWSSGCLFGGVWSITD